MFSWVFSGRLRKWAVLPGIWARRTLNTDGEKNPGEKKRNTKWTWSEEGRTHILRCRGDKFTATGRIYCYLPLCITMRSAMWWIIFQCSCLMIVDTVDGLSAELLQNWKFLYYKYSTWHPYCGAAQTARPCLSPLFQSFFFVWKFISNVGSFFKVCGKCRIYPCVLLCHHRTAGGKLYVWEVCLIRWPSKLKPLHLFILASIQGFLCVCVCFRKFQCFFGGGSSVSLLFCTNTNYYDCAFGVEAYLARPSHRSTSTARSSVNHNAHAQVLLNMISLKNEWIINLTNLRTSPNMPKRSDSLFFSVLCVDIFFTKQKKKKNLLPSCHRRLLDINENTSRPLARMQKY